MSSTTTGAGEKGDHLQILAKQFVSRASALGYKTKTRDAAALDFFLGAAIMAELEGLKDTQQRLTGVIMQLNLKGYSCLPQLIKAEAGDVDSQLGIASG